MSDATTPITSASTITDASTWRRDPPIVRIVANSRVRCAIVIESEFAITNAPTKSAMPANASRKSWRKPMNSFVPSRPRSACAPPERTCARRAEVALEVGLSCGVETPGSAATRIWSSLPSLPNSRCAVGRSNAAIVAPPRRRVRRTGRRRSAQPLTRALREAMPDVSPIRKPAFL